MFLALATSPEIPPVDPRTASRWRERGAHVTVGAGFAAALFGAAAREVRSTGHPGGSPSAGRRAVVATTQDTAVAAADVEFARRLLEGAPDSAGGTACAVAIVGWDAGACRLFARADALGWGALYYTCHPSRPLVAVADDTRLLRDLPWVDPEVDERTVVAMLSCRPWRPSATVFRAIGRIPPAHCLEWSARERCEPIVTRYWDPRRAAGMPGSRAGFEAAFRERLEAAVMDATSEHGLPATAIMMGGGYDSTLIAGEMARWSRGSAPRCISAVFPGLPCDESARIDRIGQHHGWSIETIDARKLQFDVDRVVGQILAHDVPFFNPQLPLLDAELRRAASYGVDTVVSGLGGDEIADDRSSVEDMVRAYGPPAYLRATQFGMRHARLPLRRALSRVGRAAMPEGLRRALGAAKRRLAPGSTTDPDTEWLQPPYRMTASQVQRELREVEQGFMPAAEAGELPFGSRLQRQIWQNVFQPDFVAGRAWTAVDVRMAGFRFRAPLLAPGLVELMLSTDASHLPRRYERGSFKPLFTDVVADRFPPGFVTTPWKVAFGGYNRRLLHGSLDAFEEWLFGADDWACARFVLRESAWHTMTAFRNAPDLDSPQADEAAGRLTRIIGVEGLMRELSQRS